MKHFLFLSILFLATPIFSAEKTPQKPAPSKKRTAEHALESSSSNPLAPQEKKRHIQEAGLQSNQDETRYNNYLETIIKKTQKIDREILSYRLSNYEKKLQFWEAFFQPNQNIQSIITTFCFYFPHIESETLLLHVINQIKTLSPKNRIFLLCLTTDLFARHFYLNKFANAYQALITNEELTKSFPQETQRLDSFFVKTTQEKAIADQTKTLYNLKQIQRLVKTFDLPSTLQKALAALSKENSLEQMFFLESHFSHFFRDPIQQKKLCCDLLLQQIQKVLQQTTNPLVLSIAAQILTRIAFVGSSNPQPRQIAAAAMCGYLTCTTDKNIFEQTRHKLLFYLSVLRLELSFSLQLKKNPLPMQVQQQSTAMLKELDSFKKYPEEIIVTHLSKPKIKTLLIQNGSRSLKIGTERSMMEYLFYSKGLHQKQQYNIALQIALLKLIQIFPNNEKKRVLPKTLLWQHIIDSAVAYQFLDTISSLSHNDQMLYLCPELSVPEEEQAENLYKSWHKLPAVFYQNLLAYIRTFSSINKQKILTSILFSDIIPYSTRFVPIHQQIILTIRSLASEEKWRLFCNDSFLASYLSSKKTQDSILQMITLLDAKKQEDIFSTIFSMYQYNNKDDSEVRFIKNIDQATFEKMLKTLQKAPLTTKISLLQKNPKALYQCIDRNENGEKDNILEQFTTSIVDHSAYKLSKNSIPELQTKLVKIFSKCIKKLLIKPIKWATEDEYNFYGAIPEQLPKKSQMAIAEAIIETLITQIKNQAISDSDTWVHQHYIITKLINFFENKSTEHHNQTFKKLWEKLTLNNKTLQLKRTIKQFYHDLLVTRGAQQLLEENGEIDDENDKNYSKKSEYCKKLKSTAARFNHLYNQLVLQKIFLSTLHNKKLVDIEFCFSKKHQSK